MPPNPASATILAVSSYERNCSGLENTCNVPSLPAPAPPPGDGAVSAPPAFFFPFFSPCACARVPVNGNAAVARARRETKSRRETEGWDEGFGFIGKRERSSDGPRGREGNHRSAERFNPGRLAARRDDPHRWSRIRASSCPRLPSTAPPLLRSALR